MPTVEELKYIKSWSWGGFFVPWIFLFINKQKKLAWKILILFVLIQIVSFLPFFNISGTSLSMIGNLKFLNIIYFGVCIWIGVRGREMVWDNKVYPSVEELKTKQKSVTKFNWIFLLSFWIICMALYMSFAVKYIQNPAALENQIMEMALSDAKSKDINLNQDEFKAGYSFATSTDIEISTSTKVMLFSKTDSYRKGFLYSYSIFCMDKYDNEMACTKKILEAGIVR